MIIYVMVNMVRYDKGIVWYGTVWYCMINGIVYYAVYGMGDQFWIFVKIQVIHQLNHNNVFEHLNDNNDKNNLKTATQETWGGRGGRCRRVVKWKIL